MLGAASRAGGRLLRGVSLPTRTAIRQSSGHEMKPGDNLPFSLDNPYKLTLYFTLFFGSGIGIPFLAVRHQLLKA
ncbi:cytochrome c oxidase subunit 7C, mitochondrial-like [Arctopsyche grandis]|uniref:cytochrome c oxidase subunit 7C, mitochondrial-like n=1 Tax=Arctopsyche grandis TaxID=121162 RepID=UPI00406D8351